MDEEIATCSVCGMVIFNNFEAYELTGLCGVCCFGTADALND